MRQADPGGALTVEAPAALDVGPTTDRLVDALRHYVEHGVELRVGTGQTLADEGDEQAWFHVLLEGRVEWTRRVGGSAVHVLTHTAGEYFGHEPILLDIPVPVTGTALEDTRAFRFDADAFWELLSSCPEIRRELLSAVSQRVQTLEGVSAQQARLAALGTLSAGLAHELNNPAASVRAGIETVSAALRDLSDSAIRLGRALPDDAARSAVERLRAAASVDSSTAAPAAGSVAGTSALERADAEVSWPTGSTRTTSTGRGSRRRSWSRPASTRGAWTSWPTPCRRPRWTTW